ncbi:uncharacterized protein LOC131662731 isoform X2 [Phymastichus coffea]|uniref:uncharacterized protein LOC131662731 isoform X2 n=1 Tax=Phymastichus coffea TaxID=108790 RepID=UPI00273AA8A3|nr:uncharacterized protein LOC131662731 isoform X2 [Phymastichus coffea]
MSQHKNILEENPENQRTIEEWIKRNSSGRLIIRPVKNGNCMKSNLPPNKRINTKRSLIQPNLIKTKFAKWTSPAISIEIEPVVSKSEKKKSYSESELGTVLKEDPKFLEPSKYLKNKLPNNLKKIHMLTKEGTKTVKNYTIHPKYTPILQIRDEQDVYSSVKDNYKQLLIPKHWSVTEFENDSFKPCIVFYKPHVINNNENLITVMQRSLIIDKGGTIHYSIYGLPVNVKETILPDVLDSIKKLLSILHIFDKIQICKGLGDDLLIVKTDSLVHDVCQTWRHIHCKLVLVKADQCQICLDTRNVLLEKEMLFKSEILSMQCEEIQIKEEQI